MISYYNYNYSKTNYPFHQTFYNQLLLNAVLCCFVVAAHNEDRIRPNGMEWAVEIMYCSLFYFRTHSFLTNNNHLMFFHAS